MRKIFILSTSFLTKLLLMNLHYVLNFTFDTIILLKENHNELEKFSYNIELYEDLETSIVASDVIVILSVSSIPQNTIEIVIDLARKHGKELISLKSEKEVLDYRKEGIKISNTMPLILHLAIGKASQSYGLEIIINKILSKCDINFKQYFSNKTYNILKQLSKQNVLKEGILSKVRNNNIDVVVLSIEISTQDNLHEELDRYINNLSPDVFIIQTDLRDERWKEIEKVLIRKTNWCIDIVVKSLYYPLKEGNMIYCNGLHVENAQCLEDRDIESVLEENILSKISYPIGIIPL